MILHQLIFAVLWLGACGYALARGGRPERIIAVAFLIAAPLTSATVHWVALYRLVEPSVFIIDSLLLLITLGVALWSTRFWPMAMASLQGSEVLGHVARVLAPDTVPRAYYVVVAFWSFPMVVVLGIGTWRHRRRLRRYGVDHGWVWQLPERYREGQTYDGT